LFSDAKLVSLHSSKKHKSYRAYAHDRARDLGIDPCKTYLSHGPALLFAKFLDTADDLRLPFVGPIVTTDGVDVFGTLGRCIYRAGEPATAKWTPGDQADAIELAIRNHLSLFLTV
jgi:hypothetical protein